MQVIFHFYFSLKVHVSSVSCINLGKITVHYSKIVPSSGSVKNMSVILHGSSSSSSGLILNTTAAHKFTSIG